MRPLRLDIEGFTAFKEPVSLDFSQLDLFAITGPTGAGKSSLIDAIAYALYGKVPRVSNEVVSCISQGLDRMLVGLEFMAGEDRYRIFRETRRKGTPNVRLDRWSEDGWVPLYDRAREVSDYVAGVVGLDYDGFTRSVLLPQGQFQEFLAGSSEKRRAVLSSLLRLEVYESMRKRARGMSDELKTRIEEREHTLAGLAEATPENVQHLEGELKASGLQLEVAQVAQRDLEHGLTLATALKQAQDVLGRCETEAIQALADFQKTSRAISEGDEALATVRQALESLQAELAANTYDAGLHTALSVGLERVRALEQARSALDAASTARVAAEAGASSAGAAVDAHRRALAAAEESRAAAEAAWEAARREDLDAQSQDSERQQSLGIAGERLQSLEEARTSLAQAEKAREDARVQDERAATAVANREQALEQTKQARLAAEAVWSEAQRHDLAASLQQGLKPGDECPVCGGIVGDLSLAESSDLQAAEKGLRSAQKAEGEAAASLATAAGVAAKATATLETADAQLMTITGRIEAMERGVTEALPAGVEATAAAIGKALQVLQQAREVRQARVKAAETALGQARKQEGEALTAVSAASGTATRATATLENLDAQIESLKAQATELSQSVMDVLPEGLDVSAADVAARLREQMEARTARAEVEAHLKRAAEQEQTMRVELDQAKQHFAELEHRLQAAAEAQDAAAAAVRVARADLESVAGDWPEVAEALERGANVIAVLRDRVEETRARQTTLVRAVAQTETRIEHLKAEIERAEALRKSLAELKQDHNVAADLAQMLGAAKFQTFVQQEALNTLAAHGSLRLEQLSGGRYKLQLDSRGAEFEVVDQWNADMARSVRTLSGGETFLASLALSLALAESLPGLAASRRVVLDSVFIDEGFGSLDAEALDRAAEALDALALENRMVCIVTHLPDLAQRLPARVVVTKTEAGSSVAVA